MFLSLIILLQTYIPCSKNFNRYKVNYQRFLDTNPDDHDKPKTDQEVRMIASPKMMSKLSPISKMRLVDGESLDPHVHNNLLKYAGKKKEEEKVDDTDEFDGNALGDIPIANFKSNRLSQLDRKMRNMKINEQAENKDVQLLEECVRQPNTYKRQKNLKIQTQGLDSSENALASPSSYLLGQPGSPTLKDYDVNKEEKTIEMEGEIMRLNSEGKIKKYWYALHGCELYAYKTRDDNKHKLMHSLTGVFIEEQQKETVNGAVMWPIKLIYPGNNQRVYYLSGEEDQ